MVFCCVLSRDERSAITSYFHLGLKYETIIKFLAVFHGVIISLRTLKRRLRDFGLCRTGSSPAQVIDAAISMELCGAGDLLSMNISSTVLSYKWQVLYFYEPVSTVLQNALLAGCKMVRINHISSPVPLLRYTFYFSRTREIRVRFPYPHSCCIHLLINV